MMLTLASLAAPTAFAQDRQDPAAARQDCNTSPDGASAGPGGPIQGGRQMQPSRGEIEDRLAAAGCNDVDHSQRDANDVDRIYKQLMDSTGGGAQQKPSR